MRRAKRSLRPQDDETPSVISLPNGYTLIRTADLQAVFRQVAITVRLAAEIAKPRTALVDEAIRPYARAMELLAETTRPERAPVLAVDFSRSYPKHAVATAAANPQEDETDAR